MGLAALMLIGVAAMHGVPDWITYERPSGSTGLLGRAKPAGLPAEVAFVPALPGISSGGKLANQKRVFLPALLPAVKQRHQITLPRMTAPAGPGEYYEYSASVVNGDSSETSALNAERDENFEAALVHLAPSQQLSGLRRKIRALGSMMDDAMREENYEQAERFRKQTHDLRLQDPVFLLNSLRSNKWSAAKGGRFGEAKRIEAQLHTLTKLLPQYQLGGRWMGTVRDESDEGTHRFAVQIEYDGETLIATKVPGTEVVFKADIAETTESMRIPQVHGDGMINGQPYMQSFEGVGTVDEGAGLIPGVHVAGTRPGKLYLMDDGSITFRWFGEGGDERVLEPAGGVPELVVAGQDQRGKDAGGSRGHGGEGGGESGGGFSIVFTCVERYDVAVRRKEYEELLQWQAKMNPEIWMEKDGVIIPRNASPWE